MRKIQVLLVCFSCLLLSLAVQAQEPAPEAQSPETSPLQSLYVPMRDGTRIAIDVWLPADTTQPVPTLLNRSRLYVIKLTPVR